MPVQSLARTTIVFDLDGTLVDTAPDLVGATNHVLAALSLPPRDAHELRPWISFGARRMIVEALRASRRPLSDDETDALLVPFLDYYEANIARESRPFPHAVATVETLRRSGARLAICTNKREALSLKLLRALDMDHLFDAIVGRDTLPVYKPHPGHLTASITRAGGSIDRAVMVGDSDVDIATARAAGIPIVAVTFGYSDIPVATLRPDAVLDDYRHLIPALQRLAPPA